jgi:RNA polymerase sigma-70 factor (ECF subfamily)
VFILLSNEEACYDGKDSQMDFDRLMHRHKDAVYRQLYRLCGNHDDAEDVMVEALLSAHRALEDLHHEEAFRAWLAKIASRSCVRLKQREKLRAVTDLASVAEPVDNGLSAEQSLLQSEIKSCLLTAYAALPPKYQEVYRLRDVEELSGEETAKRLGISLQAMKSRLHRARSLLRQKCDAAFLTF